MNTARIIVASLTLLSALSHVAQTQMPDSARLTRTSRWELLGSSGALLPSGTQRDAIKRAPLSTAQLLFALNPRVALLTTVGWGRSRDLSLAETPKLSIFTYDVGVESRAPHWIEKKGVSLMPFAGVGAGGRSYNHRGLDLDATHNLAAYASAGGELGMGRVHLRLEAREYVSGFKPLVGSGKGDRRQDYSLLAGLRLTRKRASE